MTKLSISPHHPNGRHWTINCDRILFIENKVLSYTIDSQDNIEPVDTSNGFKILRMKITMIHCMLWYS